MMESGEKELRMVFEEVTTKNVKAAIEYSTETRKIVRQLEEKMLHFENILREKDKEINLMKTQISLLQQKLYQGGTT